MIIRDYTSQAEKKRMQKAYIDRLAQRAELENLYGRAMARRESEMPLQVEIPKRPGKPKQAYSTAEIRDELAQKLEPFFISNEELLKFLNLLSSKNELVLFDDNLFQFERRYIQGQKRNTATQMINQWSAYKRRFSKNLVVQPEKVEMVPQDVQSPQQKLLADIKMNPLGASQLEGLSVQSAPLEIPMAELTRAWRELGQKSSSVPGDFLSEVRAGRGRLKKTQQRKVPVLNERLPEDDEKSGVESISRSVEELRGILAPQIQRNIERPITNELTVKELKSILKSNGLKVSGTKNELIQRLFTAGITKYMPSDVKTVAEMREEFEAEVKDQEEMAGTGMLYVPKKRRLNAHQFGRGIKNRRTKRVMLSGIIKAGNDNQDLLRAFSNRF